MDSNETDYNCPMTYRHFKYEGWLYVLAFLLAIGLRLIQLGVMPLTDVEASSALQALHIAQGLKPALNPHPFYILSTSVLFFLYGGGTNFLARFMPAFVGSLLVFAPLCLKRITPRPGLLLAFFIALDPGLTALSRQAASPIFAIAFLIFAWGFFDQNKPRIAGFFAALALLGGPSIWTGLLGLGIAWAILQGIGSIFSSRIASIDEDDEEHLDADSPMSESQPSTFNYKQALLPFIITFITAGTLFSIAPNGLSAALASIPTFINSWLSPSDVPAVRLLFSLLVYQPLAVLLALFAIIRGFRNGSPRIISLSLWFLVALLLAIFIPSRQVADLAWALIPLCALAALELVRSVDIFPEERMEILGVILLTAFVWVFAWLDFSGLIWLTANSREFIMRFWLLIGALLLLVFSILLIAAGWSISVARIGAVWGLALALGALGFGGALGSAGLHGLKNPELWWPPSIPAQADLLDATVSEMSQWGLGDNNAAPVVIAGVNSPALEWALRGHNVIVAETIDISSSPYFVITPLQNNPALSASYRGQDFNWRQTPSWNATTYQDWIRWIALREMPQSGEAIILWVRDDLFLDAAPQPTP
jgi:hypothetical protein